MITRILPQAEWPRLAETEAGPVWPHLNPAHAQVLVVEHQGQIAGCWVLMHVLHAECLYIAPAYRHRPSVGRRLLVGLTRLATDAGMGGVWTAATSDAVRHLLEKFGAARMPGDHYIMPIGRA